MISISYGCSHLFSSGQYKVHVEDRKDLYLSKYELRSQWVSGCNACIQNNQNDVLHVVDSKFLLVAIPQISFSPHRRFFYFQCHAKLNSLKNSQQFFKKSRKKSFVCNITGRILQKKTKLDATIHLQSLLTVLSTLKLKCETVQHVGY